ncbi:MAG: OmpA family protein [Pseudomonadota bacterium]
MCRLRTFGLAFLGLLVAFPALAFNVSIDQSVNQDDPTNNNLVLYQAVFSEPIDRSSFDCSDITVAGDASASCFIVLEQGPMDGTDFQVALNVITDGNVLTFIDTGVVSNAGNTATNFFSTSSDNVVKLDTTPPAQEAVLTSPSLNDNNPNAPIAGRCGNDAAFGEVLIESDPENGFSPYPATAVLDSQGQFNIPVNWSEGEFDPVVYCYDQVGNGPTITQPYTSPFNSVNLDFTPPVPTIDVPEPGFNQPDTDPTNLMPALFIVTISEAISIPPRPFELKCNDIDYSASTAPGTTCSTIQVLGNNRFFVEMRATDSGDITISIPPGSFTDLAGNDNLASVHTDNTIEYINISPRISLDNTDGYLISGYAEGVNSFDVNDSNNDLICTVNIADVYGENWSCSPTGFSIPGDAETIRADGTSIFGIDVISEIDVDALQTAPDKDLDGIPDRVELYEDADNDGIDDYWDPDSDNDGIPDIVEAGDLLDDDGDGISNLFDVDFTKKYDPELDGVDATNLYDRDKDGITDHRDPDSDGDGLPDFYEAQISGNDADGDGIDDTFDVDMTGGIDTNGDGIDDEVLPPNTDGRGLPDYQTPDSDSDGLTDTLESNITLTGSDADNDGIDDAVDADADGDGIVDPGKSDSNGDGIDDAIEIDTDGDGILDRFDLDSDNDSRFDVVEAGLPDTNNDAFVDEPGLTVSSAPDSDGDGTADFRDRDSDGDGAFDISDGAFSDADQNGDGAAEITDDVDRDGIMLPIDIGPTVYGNIEAPEPDDDTDTDGDGIIDAFDRDSDNDLIPDAVEVRLPGGLEAQAWLNTDSDGDGLGDYIESGLQASGVDTDGDGIDNAFDADFNGDGINEPGKLDIDGDGVIDTVIDQVRDTDGDGIPDMLDTDSDNDGYPDSGEARNDFDEDGKEDYIDFDDPVSTGDKGGASFGPACLLAILFALVILRTRGKKKWLFLLLCLSGGAQADSDTRSVWSQCSEETGVEFTAGQSTIEADTSPSVQQSEDGGSAFELRGYCRIAPKIRLEAAYAQLGETAFEHLNPALNPLGTMDVSALSLSAQYRTPLWHPRLGVFGRLGVNKIMVDESATLPTDTDDGVKSMLGFGADWFFSDRWRVLVQYEKFTENTDYLGIGLSVHLGTPKQFPVKKKPRVARPVSQTAVVKVEEKPVESKPTPSLPDLILVYDPSLKQEAREKRQDQMEAQENAPMATSLTEAELDELVMPILPAAQLQAGSCNEYESAQGPAVTVGFAVGHSGMTYEAYEKLQHFAACMSYRIAGDLRVEGHTDDVASARYNKALSQKRANSVKAFLTFQGIPEENIEATGLGEERFIKDNSDKVSRSHNRRVEVYIVK